jgi:hypothetical protein
MFLNNFEPRLVITSTGTWDQALSEKMSHILGDGWEEMNQIGSIHQYTEGITG